MSKEPKDESIMIAVPLSEYMDILRDSMFLECLRAAGVDNWEGYDEAWNMWREEDSDSLLASIRSERLLEAIKLNDRV